MDAQTLAEFITAVLDGTYGPDDEGHISAGYEGGGFVVEYQDDEFGIVSKFRLVIEAI